MTGIKSSSGEALVASSSGEAILKKNPYDFMNEYDADDEDDTDCDFDEHEHDTIQPLAVDRGYASDQNEELSEEPPELVNQPSGYTSSKSNHKEHAARPAIEPESEMSEEPPALIPL